MIVGEHAARVVADDDGGAALGMLGLDEGGEFAVDEDDAGAAVLEDVRYLGRGVADVDRLDDAGGSKDGMVGLQDHGAVGGNDGDDGARLEGRRGAQGKCQAEAARGPLGVREAVATLRVHDGTGVGRDESSTQQEGHWRQGRVVPGGAGGHGEAQHKGPARGRLRRAGRGVRG